MKDSMFQHPETAPIEDTALVEGNEVDTSQKVITIAQILVEGKKTKYALVAGDQIVDCVDGFEELIQELLIAFGELPPESELGAATF